MTAFILRHDLHKRGKPPERVSVEGTDFDEFFLLGRKDETGRRRVLVHIEMMDTHIVWMQVGDAKIDVSDRPSGVSVGVERGEYGEAVGWTNAPHGETVLTYEHKVKRGKGRARGR